MNKSKTFLLFMSLQAIIYTAGCKPEAEQIQPHKLHIVKLLSNTGSVIQEWDVCEDCMVLSNKTEWEFESNEGHVKISMPKVGTLVEEYK